MAAHEDTGPSEAELAMQVCFLLFLTVLNLFDVQAMLNYLSVP